MSLGHTKAFGFKRLGTFDFNIILKGVIKIFGS
jgi:hypothetical protein